jgi:hypothetical protein
MINTAINLFQKFSNRELAIAIWILIAVIWALSQPKLRKSLFQVLKAFFAWKLAISYVIMFSYITLMIIPLNAVGIWKLPHLQITILWVLYVAFVMLFEFSKASNQNFFKDAIKDNIKGLIVLEFLINLYVFDLWVELFLVPVFVILGGMIAIAGTDKKYEIAKKLLNYIMAFIGLAFTSYAIYMVVTDFKHFATFKNLENYYLPILFSIMFLPFVYFAALYAGYESLFVRLRFFVRDVALLKYVKKKTILAFGTNLWVLNKWSKHINTLRFKDKKEVDEAVRDFKSAKS